jgi:tetratricopeptide (TPR) repeat protein
MSASSIVMSIVMSEQIAGFMEAAIMSYGTAVLTATDGQGGGPDAEFGRRLIWEVVGGKDLAGSLHAVLAEPSGRPEDDDVFSRLEDWVSDVLDADPVLVAAAAQMLAAFYQHQFEAGHAAAMADLGRLLLAQGKEQEARAACRQAADAGHLHALIMLARLDRADRRDPDGVRAAYQEAIDCADPDVSAEAQVDLGRLLLRAYHDYAGATAAFQRAVEAGRPFWALTGMRGLASVLHQQGDLDGERAVYEQMIDAGDPWWTANALVSLAKLLESQRDAAGAKAAYWRVLDESPSTGWHAHGHGDWTAHALINLVNLLQWDDDLDGARAAYRKAAQTGNRGASYALVVIGRLLEARGDTAGARAAYQQATDTGYHDPDVLLENLQRLSALEQQAAGDAGSG